MFAGRPIIGLVGGIGAGKSRVARLLEEAGCCRIASDEMVRAAYTHPEVKRAVVERFGGDVLDPGGRVDRGRIADIVFQNADDRRWLEALLHPFANQARVVLMEQAASDPGVLAYVWDSPLLYEAKLDELCDTVIFVDAPREDRLRRVAERGWDESELDRREKVQMPLDKKRAKAEYHVRNTDAEPATGRQVSELLKEILERFGVSGAGGCGCGGMCACAAAAEGPAQVAAAEGAGGTCRGGCCRCTGAPDSST